MPSMVMERTLPPASPTHSESSTAKSPQDLNNSKSGVSGASPVSSIRLLKPKQSGTKKSSELVLKASPVGGSKLDLGRRSVSEITRKNVAEKRRMSLSEGLRKSMTEKPRRSASFDHKNAEKQEMEALVKRLSTPNGTHHPPIEQAQQVQRLEQVEMVEDQDVKGEEKDVNGEAKDVNGEETYPDAENPQEGAKELSPPVRAVSPVEKATKSKVAWRVAQNTTTEIPARKSKTTTPVKRPNILNISDISGEEELSKETPSAPPAPPPPANVLPLMPVATVDAIMNDEVQGENPQLGPYLLKLAKSYATSANPVKALEYGSRAVKFYEKQAENGNPSLDLIVSLHILAALHGRLGQYDDAVPLLERSVAITDLEDDEEHALAKFSGHMQLGDTYNLLGKQGSALGSYHAALAVQKATLGDLDPRVGETCHYIAEAHLQAMEFDSAEALCEHALSIHGEYGEPGSLEEAADRRLLALVLSAKGDHENALENLAHASATLQANNLELDVAAVNSSIGDELLVLGRDSEAVLSYQKALLVFKALKGDNHPLVAACYASLAELYLKTNKPREAKSYCENALRIYGKQGSGHNPEDIANGLTDIAAIYDQLNEKDTALVLLQQALNIQDSMPGQQAAVGGIEAQMGILYNMMDKFMPALEAFKSATNKLRNGGVQKTALLAMLLNQMGITCVELGDIEQASQLFQESRSILEETCGPHHLDTLDVCTNLAGSYDALGRLDEAIKLLEYVVQVKEDKLGTVHPDVHDDRERLQELLKDVGRTYTPKTRKLEELLVTARKENRKR